MKKVTQAVLLSGGKSSRFYPYNSLGHKSLLTLGGKSLIIRTLENLKSNGIKEFIIIEDSSSCVSNILSQEEVKLFNIKFIVQKKPLGMGNAILSASDLLSERYFVINAYHFEAGEFIKEMSSAQKKESDIVILVRLGEDNTEFGLVNEIDGKIKIVEKSKDKTSGMRIIGIYLLNLKFVEILKNVSEHEYNFEDAISLYSEKETIVTVETNKETVSLKYPWSVLDAKDFLLRRMKRDISSKANISKNAVLNGDVIIEKGVVIKEGVAITGPAYIGENVFIGNNVIIRGGVLIEKDVVIGANMEVKNTVIMKNTTTHSGFIGDSVIGENTKIAAGFTTGNVRLDRGEISSDVRGEKVNTKRKMLGVLMGSHTSLGIKVGTMPGVIIGNNVIVGPGTTVMENVPDGMSFYTEFRKIVKKEDA